MLLLLSHALAHDSEPQPLVFEDLVDVYQGAEFSTGFVPSGSPVQVQFAIESTGGVDVSLEGTGHVSWPNALTLLLEPTEGSGLFLLDASLDAVTTLAIDLSDWGYYGTFELDRRSLAMDGSAVFEPFVLDGAADEYVEVVDPGDSTSLIDYAYEILPGLSLEFLASLRPEAAVGFSGVAIFANGDAIEHEGQALAVEYEPVGDLLLETIYEADWEASLSLVVTPELQVCADPFGCVTLAAFDIPIPLLESSERRDFPSLYPIYPLPLVEPGMDQADFGTVAVGSLENIDLPIVNEGSLTLSGEATILGSADFRVYPATFTALAGGEDGLVLTFAPSAEGPQTAELVLISNDPGQPELRIPLSGNAELGGDDVVGEDEEVVVKPLDGCGCSTGGAAVVPAGLLLLLLPVVRRRR